MSLEIPRGREVLKAKMLEAKYEAKLEFPEGKGGGGARQKNLPLGGVRILSGTAHCIIINGLHMYMYLFFLICLLFILKL